MEGLKDRRANQTPHVNYGRKILYQNTSQYEQLDSIPNNPKPIQQPIPIWMGGTDNKVMDRTVRVADGWIPQGKGVEFNGKFLPQLNKSLESLKENQKLYP